jgi:predicted O-methyltransferase YrrM
MVNIAGTRVRASISQAFWRLRQPKLAKSFAIQSHLTSRERLELFNLAGAIGTRSIVEIGSYLGASATALGAGLKNAKNDAARIYCVDTWNNDAMTEGQCDTYAAFLENTAPYRKWIVPTRGWSAEVAATIASSVGRVDLLFIDGDHSYSGCLADWRAYADLLRPGARVAFHDVGWADGVQRVIDEAVRPLVCLERRLPNLWWGEMA